MILQLQQAPNFLFHIQPNTSQLLQQGLHFTSSVEATEALLALDPSKTHVDNKDKEDDQKTQKNLRTEKEVQNIMEEQLQSEGTKENDNFSG